MSQNPFLLLSALRKNLYRLRLASSQRIGHAKKLLKPGQTTTIEQCMTRDSPPPDCTWLGQLLVDALPEDVMSRVGKDAKQDLLDVFSSDVMQRFLKPGLTLVTLNHEIMAVSLFQREQLVLWARTSFCVILETVTDVLSAFQKFQNDTSSPTVPPESPSRVAREDGPATSHPPVPGARWGMDRYHPYFPITTSDKLFSTKTPETTPAAKPDAVEHSAPAPPLPWAFPSTPFSSVEALGKGVLDIAPSAGLEYDHKEEPTPADVQRYKQEQLARLRETAKDPGYAEFCSQSRWRRYTPLGS